MAAPGICYFSVRSAAAANNRHPDLAGCEALADDSAARIVKRYARRVRRVDLFKEHAGAAFL